MKPANLFLHVAIYLALFLVITPVLVAQEYIPDSSFWETKGNMNQARSYFPAAALDGKIYAFGGIIADNGVVFTYTNTLEEYDANSDHWTTKGTLPQAMGAMATVTLGDAIYIIGGLTDPTAVNSIQKVYRYFPASGTFDADTIASLPAPKSFLSACELGGKIYAIGGASGFFGTVSKTVYVYDPSKNEWSLGPSLNIGRAVHTCVVVGTKIYVLGGTVSWLSSLNSVEVFDGNDPGKGWVLSDKPLLHARAGHGSVVLSGIIYALGGIESISSAEMSAEAYLPAKKGDTWEVFNYLPYNRRAFGCIALSMGEPFSYIYLFGGNSGSSVISSTQRLAVNTIVGVNEHLSATPERLSNFPNPFNQSTTITYTLDKPTTVVIAIYDTKGTLVATPVSGLQSQGVHHVPFVGTGLETGVYFCVMRSEGGAGFAREMVVIR